MDEKLRLDENARSAWQKLVTKYQLAPETEEIVLEFISQLLDWNTRMNLTRITDVPSLLHDHIEDSLAVAPFLEIDRAPFIVDVGAGAGFPSLPLKICFPSLPMVLIEVNAKKRTFLQAMIERFHLQNCEVCPLDWRTFLRTTNYPVSYFLARASLRPDELVRAFKPDCWYNKSTVVYWASRQWQPDSSYEHLIQKDITYEVGEKKRRLIFLKSGGKSACKSS